MPTGTIGGMTRRAAVPILMYHNIGAEKACSSDTCLNVPARDFARQMRLLARLGYRAVTFREAVIGLRGEGPLPPRPFCITLDDGFRCAADHALAVLRPLGWSPTVFVASDWLGCIYAPGGKPANETDRVMDAEELRSLVAQGWEIAGHTRSHALLGSLSDAAASDEIIGGADDLSTVIGERPSTFCYPGGSFNDRTPLLVREAGMHGACTTRSGLARAGMDLHLLPRIKPATRDGMAGFLYRFFVRPWLP